VSIAHALTPAQQRHVAKHAKKPSAEAAAPALAGQLPSATVAAFRAAWPRLDPAACKTDFDAWLLGKTQPRNYAQAFLGFAAKWASRKTNRRDSRFARLRRPNASSAKDGNLSIV
jgi:hypothetical protein